MRDYYQNLELTPEATTDEVKRAYRRLAKAYHPDANDSEEAHARFIEIAEAYEVLSDPQRRQLYDRRRAVGLHDGDDSLQRMAEAFARAQAAARAQAEAAYQRKRAQYEARQAAKAAEEARWRRISRLATGAGLLMVLLMGLDLAFTTWTEPAVILDIDRPRNGRYAAIQTLDGYIIVRREQSNGISKGWRVRKQRTPIFDEPMGAEAWPPSQPDRIRHLYTGVSLYGPMRFMPILLALFTLASFYPKFAPLRRLQVAVGVFTFMGLCGLVIVITR